jgi:predicted naringenin-chalcone synthase
MINWGHVVVTHAPQVMLFGVVLLFAQIVHQVVTDLGIPLHPKTVWSQRETVWMAVHKLLVQWSSNVLELFQTLDLFSPAVKTTFALLLVAAWYLRRQNPVYLLGFATFKAPDSWKCSHKDICEIMRRQKCFTDDSINFMERILERSGTGQATAWPPGIVQCLHDPKAKSDRSIAASRKEAEIVIFDVVEKALQRAKVHPREIDVLVINCSLFSPTPSLCAMVLSHFEMRSDVLTYNLSGMGCSASLISVDLAQQLLAGKRGRSKKALIVSTEILTPNFYHGNDRGFLIQNTLFRCGGAAIVLSNSWLDGRRAWYKLLHTVRVQGTGEAAYECVYEAEDSKGERGVRLSMDIVKVAGKCMEKNFTMLGPQILPYSEQALVATTILLRIAAKQLAKFLKTVLGTDKIKVPVIKPYVPDFKKAIDHFCIHAGGRAVIDGIESNLKLRDYHTEPSRMTLLNYGNTSSSSIWYELEYIQDLQRTHPLKKGDKVLQVAFGSGFKCTSGVWLKL